MHTEAVRDGNRIRVADGVIVQEGVEVARGRIVLLKRAEDRSRAVADVGGRMRAARDRYRGELIAAEGAETFEAFQDFLDWYLKKSGYDARYDIQTWICGVRPPIT